MNWSKKCNFVVKTFVDYSLVPPSVNRDFKQSRRKLSLIDIKQSVKFAKVFSLESFPLYGVYLISIVQGFFNFIVSHPNNYCTFYKAWCKYIYVYSK